MRLFGESVGHWGSYVLKQVNPWQNLKNHLQLPNIFILLSFFASLSHNLKVNRVGIWLYWYFLSKRWGYLGKLFSIEVDTAQNREIPCKFSNLLIKLSFSCFIFYVFSFCTKNYIKGEIFVYVRENMSWPFRRP